MTVKDAFWREIKYGLCGASGALRTYVDQDHVAVDARDDIDAEQSEDDYLWLIITRIIRTEENDTGWTRDRLQLELIGLLRSANVGDDNLEAAAKILKNHFIGKHITIGKFSATGTAEPNGGLRVKCEYIDTVDGFTADVREKSLILQFAAHHMQE